jgi:hypothetical protein
MTNNSQRHTWGASKRKDDDDVWPRLCRGLRQRIECESVKIITIK